MNKRKILFRNTIDNIAIIVKVACAVVIKVNVQGHMQINVRISEMRNVIDVRS